MFKRGLQAAMTETREKSTTANRLVNETSTYLQQHAYNPVDWYPWSEEALTRAKEEEKPILLSIGYAACHWCHVMEHESFEDEETAALMNAEFINIKVDREERTDLDEIYMKAVQLMTGHGGWPMTVFLTPQLKPIFAGTYFPPDDRHGMPSFRKILSGVSRAWKEKRIDVLKSADEVTEHLIKFESMGDLKSVLDLKSDAPDFDFGLLNRAFSLVYKYLDDAWGGIGSAPKFPQPFCLALAMRILVSEKSTEEQKDNAHHFLTLTLDKMAYGGMHDHLGGGFARYSVDRKWLIPHFEKMLYDNALLASIYFDASRIRIFEDETENKFKSDYWREVGRGILSFVKAELGTEEGAFYSSLDADSEGKEGEFYVWTPEEIESLLPEEDARLFMRVYGVTERGNFEEGKSALHILMAPHELAGDLDMTLEQFKERIEPMKAELLARRAKRVRPGLDEKVLTSWNSLMISGFIAGYKVERNQDYLKTATDAADFIIDNLLKDGRLLRTWGKGVAKLNGYLDDYAYFIQALLDILEVMPSSRYMELVLSLTETMLELFYDDEGDKGGFYYTGEKNQEDLILRPRSHFDGSVPSGSSVAVTNLVRLYKLTADKRYLDKARVVFGIYGQIMEKRPEQFGNLLCALDTYIEPGREVVVVLSSEEEVPDRQEMIFAVHENFRPRDVFLITDSSAQYDLRIIEGKSAQANRSTVYICENHACQEPISSIEKVRQVL